MGCLRCGVQFTVVEKKHYCMGDFVNALNGMGCLRCGVQFTVVEKKHYCKACEQKFCGRCSQKKTTLPKLHTNIKVKVCDSCYDQHTKPTSINILERARQNQASSRKNEILQLVGPTNMVQESMQNLILKQLKLIPAAQNKPAGQNIPQITSLTFNTTQVLHRNNPLVVSRRTRLPPSMSQTMSKNEPQTDIVPLPQQISLSVEPLPRNNTLPLAVSRRRIQAVPIPRMPPPTHQILPKNKPQTAVSRRRIQAVPITCLPPPMPETLSKNEPQTGIVPQPQQIQPSVNSPCERCSVRLTQKQKLELMRKKKQEFLKKQQELATQGN
ncbi:FYVE zinc finger [Popillia japonica]|uniref:FYVE zinc finger n=1 Tax=Popillia japonica TaxID=7064 RepID=A0AAW1JIQ7_POPJA